MIRSRFGALALLMAGSALLPACAQLPELGEKPIVRELAAYAANRSLAPADTVWPGSAWWSDYGDPQLDILMKEALAGSPDLAIAQARVRKAEGYAQQAGAALYPSVDASGSAGYSQQSENNGIPSAFVPKGWNDTGKVSIGLNFDLDLWGKNRAALAAATSDLEASKYDLAQARLMLTTNVAATYAELARLYAERDTAVAALAIRMDSLKLVSDRVTNGLDTRAELKQAESRVPAARAELGAIDETIALNRNALAALLGAGPDRGSAIDRPAIGKLHAKGVPTSASIDLVGRRPDVAAARALVEASASRIKVARAAFYPNISLGAIIGLQSLGLGNLLEGGSTYGNVGPAISLPIFHGGATSGQYRGARGTYDEAVARYDASVVAALRQVADAITSQNALARQIDDAREALAAAEEANALARRRYQGGLSTYLDALSAEERVVEARRSVTQLEARNFTLDVAMVRALGGGFQSN